MGLEQLNEIRKVKLSRLICDNGDDVDSMQVYAMVLPDHDINPRVPCKSGVLKSIDSLERSPRGSAEEPGLLVEAGVPPLGEVNALEHARLAGHAGVDVVVGQHHGVHLHAVDVVAVVAYQPGELDLADLVELLQSEAH